MPSHGRKWALGSVYIVAVAAIWIGASYIVQSIVDGGVSPFLITYICNSLFVVYIPIVEIARHLEDSIGNFCFWCRTASVVPEFELESTLPPQDNSSLPPEAGKQLDAKGHWTRTRMAKVSLLICPFWFLAQLTFNLSLKYTTVTSNSIVSSASSLLTFLVSLAFLSGKFTWFKLMSVLLCMGGTMIVTLGDSQTGINAIAPDPLLGYIFALLSAALYAIYITLITKNLHHKDQGEGEWSMAQFFGFLGLFNFLIFLPVVLMLSFTKLEPFHTLSWEQLGLIVGKGVLDNVLSDFLSAKVVHLTTTTEGPLLGAMVKGLGSRAGSESSHFVCEKSNVRPVSRPPLPSPSTHGTSIG